MDYEAFRQARNRLCVVCSFEKDCHYSQESYPQDQGCKVLNETIDIIEDYIKRIKAQSEQIQELDATLYTKT